MPLNDAVGNDFTHILTTSQLIYPSRKNVFQIRKTTSQGFGYSSPHVQNPQPINHSPHVPLLALLNSFQKILRGLFTHPLEIHQMGGGEVVKVRDIADQAGADELAHQHLAAAFD